MRFTFEILPEQRTIVARYEGQCSLEKLLAATRTLWADTRYSPDYDGLVDLSQAEPSLALGDLRSLTDYLRAAGETSRGRWAAIAETPLVTAAALLYRRIMQPQHTLEVFSTVDAACAFLHRDSSQLQAELSRLKN